MITLITMAVKMLVTAIKLDVFFAKLGWIF